MQQHHGLAVRRTGLQYVHPDPVGVDEGRAHARKRSTTASLARDPSREQAPIVTEDRPSGWLSRSDPDGNLALRPHRGSGGKVRRFALTVWPPSSLRRSRLRGAGRAVAGLPAAARRLGSVPQAPLAGRAECGFVTVPLDYAQPGGEKIQLAVSRVKHKVADAKAQGAMLVNPGGPGGSGPDARGARRVVPMGRRRLRLDRLRPARRRRQQARAELHPDYAGYNRAVLRAGARARIEQAWLDPGQAYAKACDEDRRRAAART